MQSYLSSYILKQLHRGLHIQMSVSKDYKNLEEKSISTTTENYSLPNGTNLKISTSVNSVLTINCSKYSKSSCISTELLITRTILFRTIYLSISIRLLERSYAYFFYRSSKKLSRNCYIVMHNYVKNNSHDTPYFQL